jgi:hypothetical protein
VSSKSYWLSGSTTERAADSTSNCMHEVSWSSPPSIICYSLQNYCFLYLHLNVLMISKSKSCSWWVQLAGKTQPLCFWEMCTLNEQYSDQRQKEFSIFGIHFHVELCKYHGSHAGICITVIFCEKFLNIPKSIVHFCICPLPVVAVYCCHQHYMQGKL